MTCAQRSSPGWCDPFRRALGGVLAALYLALAAASGLPHAGEHESGLAWLPPAYHHHEFALDQGAGPLSEIAERCIACQLGRTGPRLTATSPPVAPPPILEPVHPRSAPAARSGARLVPAPRGPPVD